MLTLSNAKREFKHMKILIKIHNFKNTNRKICLAPVAYPAYPSYRQNKILH